MSRRPFGRQGREEDEVKIHGNLLSYVNLSGLSIVIT
jgi:hypothetical protein